MVYFSLNFLIIISKSYNSTIGIMSVSPPQLSDLLQIDPHLSDFSPKIVSLYTAFTETLQTLSQYEGKYILPICAFFDVHR